MVRWAVDRATSAVTVTVSVPVAMRTIVVSNDITDPLSTPSALELVHAISTTHATNACSVRIECVDLMVAMMTAKAAGLMRSGTLQIGAVRGESPPAIRLTTRHPAVYFVLQSEQTRAPDA